MAELLVSVRSAAEAAAALAGGAGAAAYADWQRAGAPAPAEVCAFACDQHWGAFLLDTWGKDGTTLLDWLPAAEVAVLCQRCRRAGVPVALAGSLGAPQIRAL